MYYGFNSVPTGVGYFPRSLFTYLGNNASQMAFGGGVAALRSKLDLVPAMGSNLAWRSWEVHVQNGAKHRGPSERGVEAGDCKPIDCRSRWRAH